MLVTKILFNSVISTPGARFMTMDISNFYLMTPLLCLEYIQIQLSDLPDKIINAYRLKDMVRAKGFIHLKVTKCIKLVPGFWKHQTRPIQFTLVVDNFGVQYIGREHAEHLKKV
ncbi:hypothetical protein ACHAW6_000903 [Cyclotella cf. meneghiniana]